MVKLNHILFLFILWFSCTHVLANQNNNIQYSFNQTDSSYSFSGSFMIDVLPECLLNIFFDYNHIKALAPSAENVKLIEKGNNWNKISYEYNAFIFSNKTVWYRTISEDSLIVNFKLLSSLNNSSLMPEMTSSTGFYQITVQNNGLLVNYYQECTLTKSLFTNLYINQVKKEAVEFLHWLRKYAISKCE